MPTYNFTLPALFDAIQDPAALIDAEGRFVDLNSAFLARAAQRGFSLVKEAWIGRLFWDTPLLRDPRGCEAFVRRALTQGHAGARGRFIYDLDTEVHIELSLTPLRDLQGQMLGGLMLWKNITPQVRRDQRQEVIPQVREVIWNMGSSSDIAGILVAVRNGLEKLGVPFANCGVNLVDAAGPEPQVYSHSMTEEGNWLPTKADDPGSETVLRIWRSQELAYRRDLDREDLYGEAGWIRTDFSQPIRSVVDVPFSHGTMAVNSAAPEAFDQEDLNDLQAMARVLSEGFQRLEDFRLLEQRNRELEREVAERRRAEETLQESEARIRRLMDDLPIGIALSTPEGRVLYWNPYNEKLFGYQLEELSGVRAQDLYSDLADREELIHNLAATGEHAFEIQLRRKDGQHIWTRGKTRVYRDNADQVYYLGITEDITEAKSGQLRQQVHQQVRGAICEMQGTQDLPKLLHAIQQGLRLLGVNFTSFGINLIDAHIDPPLVTNHGLTPEGAWHRVSNHQNADHPLLQIWKQGKLMYRPDIHREDLYGEKRLLEKYGLRCLADAPFSQGTLAISSSAPAAFTDRDLELLEEMAPLLAEGFKRLADLQSLERRAQEAEILANAIALVAKTPDLEEVFQAVVQQAALLMEAERASLFLYNSQEGTLVPRAQVGHDWQTYQQIRLKPGEDMSGQVFATGQPYIYRGSTYTLLPSVRPQTLELFRAAVQGKKLGGGAAVPLRLRERIIGTLSVGSTERVFAQYDLDLLARLAEQAALAIERAGHLRDLGERNVRLEREIAERRQAESALRLAQFTLEQASEAVFWFGADGRFFFVNEAACQMLGYHREELRSLSILDIDADFPPEQTWADTWAFVKQHPAPRTKESRYCRKGGTSFPVEITATYLEFDGREFVCTFARDITPRKQLESQLRQMYQAIGRGFVYIHLGAIV